MAENAAIWRIYEKEATNFDEHQIKAWNGSLDTLLIFVSGTSSPAKLLKHEPSQAGLFSAVSTAFIVESLKLMQPDFTELTFQTLSALVAANLSQPLDQSSFQVKATSRAVNCLWITSLILSLTTALIGILAKQWLSAYPAYQDTTIRDWVKIRQYRYDALHSWRVPEIIASLPAFLHASLLLFLAGLVIFLLPIDLQTGMLALGLSSLTGIVYTFTLVSPLIRSSSPFRSQFTPLIRDLYISLRRWMRFESVDDGAGDEWHMAWMLDSTNVLADAISWLDATVRSAEISSSILHALGDMEVGPSIAGSLAKELWCRVFEDMMSQTDDNRLTPSVTALYFRAASNFVVATRQWSAQSPNDHDLGLVTQQLVDTLARRIIYRQYRLPSTELGELSATSDDLRHIVLADEVEVIAACYLRCGELIRTDSLLHIISQAARISVTRATLSYVTQTLATVFLHRTPVVGRDFDQPWDWIEIVRHIYAMASGWRSLIDNDQYALHVLVSIGLKQIPPGAVAELPDYLASACARAFSPSSATQHLSSGQLRPTVERHLSREVDTSLCNLIDILSSSAIAHEILDTEPQGECLRFLCSLHGHQTNCSGHFELIHYAIGHSDWVIPDSIGDRDLLGWLHAARFGFKEISILSCADTIRFVSQTLRLWTVSPSKRAHRSPVYNEVIESLHSAIRSVIQHACPQHQDATTCRREVLTSMIFTTETTARAFAAFNETTNGTLIIDMLEGLTHLKRHTDVRRLLVRFLERRYQPWDLETLCLQLVTRLRNGIGASSEELWTTADMYHSLRDLYPVTNLGSKRIVRSLLSHLGGHALELLRGTSLVSAYAFCSRI